MNFKGNKSDFFKQRNIELLLINLSSTNTITIKNSQIFIVNSK